MNKSTCPVDACDGSVYARGLCRRHYDQARRGATLTVGRGSTRVRPECGRDGCVRPHEARGLCKPHYERAREKAKRSEARALREAAAPVTREPITRPPTTQAPRACPECGLAFVPNHTVRIYCGNRCKWIVRDRNRMADPEKRRLFYERQSAQKRERVAGVCTGCGANWVKSRSATSTLCETCLGVPPSRVMVRPGKINTANKMRAQSFGVEFEDVDVLRLYEDAGWLCWLCDGAVERDAPATHPLAPSLDHKIPLSRGGGHVLDNCALAHRACNVRKGARVLVA